MKIGTTVCIRRAVTIGWPMIFTLSFHLSPELTAYDQFSVTLFTSHLHGNTVHPNPVLRQHPFLNSTAISPTVWSRLKLHEIKACYGRPWILPSVLDYSGKAYLSKGFGVSSAELSGEKERHTQTKSTNSGVYAEHNVISIFLSPAMLSPS